MFRKKKKRGENRRERALPFVGENLAVPGFRHFKNDPSSIGLPYSSSASSSPFTPFPSSPFRLVSNLDASLFGLHPHNTKMGVAHFPRHPPLVAVSFETRAPSFLCERMQRQWPVLFCLQFAAPTKWIKPKIVFFLGTGLTYSKQRNVKRMRRATYLCEEFLVSHRNCDKDGRITSARVSI